LGADAVALTLLADGTWSAQVGGRERLLRLHGQSTVFRGLVVLCFQEHAGRRRLDWLLWRREIPAEPYRQLQLYLRLAVGSEL
jgi:hypothetical protein